MTEQFHTLPIEEMRERVELAERMAKAQGETVPSRATKIVTNKPEGFYVDKKTAKRGLGAGALIGTGLLAGAVLFGGIKFDNTSANPTAAPTGAPAGETAKPNPTEASGFQPKETREGWERKDMELVDGSTIQVDMRKITVADKEGVVLSKGSIVAGDVSADGVFQMDSDQLTGGILINEKEGTILTTPYGSTAYENYDPSKKDAIVETIKAQQDEDGCGLPEGCESTQVVVYGADGSPSETTQPTETQHPEGCQCQICCMVCALPSASPMPSETPAVGCPEDTSDIEHNPDEWEGNGLPVEEHDGPAIFQADGTVFIDGKKIKTYDSDGSSAHIYVVDDVVDGEPVKYQYDWIYGDLQTICPTLSKVQKDAVLQKDIEQTLARTDITSVKITYVNPDGTFRSETIRE